MEKEGLLFDVQKSLGNKIEKRWKLKYISNELTMHVFKQSHWKNHPRCRIEIEKEGLLYLMIKIF